MSNAEGLENRLLKSGSMLTANSQQNTTLGNSCNFRKCRNIWTIFNVDARERDPIDDCRISTTTTRQGNSEAYRFFL